MKFITVHTLEPEIDEYWTQLLEDTPSKKITDKNWAEHRTGRWIKKPKFINADTILYFEQITPGQRGDLSDFMPKEVRSHLKTFIHQDDSNSGYRHFVVESCDDILAMINK